MAVLEVILPILSFLLYWLFEPLLGAILIIVGKAFICPTHETGKEHYLRWIFVLLLGELVVQWLGVARGLIVILPAALI